MTYIFWTLLIICHCRQTVAAIINSEANIRSAFCRILDRCPSPAEIQLYSKAHRLPDAQVNELVRQIAMLPEFEHRYVTKNTNSDAVDSLFLMILGRLPNPNGKKNWQKILRTHGYKYVVNQLIDSPEYRHKYGTTLVPGYGTCKEC